jgi:predicted rRNA methylase YqxC with S4 and FtsJ domains
MSSTGGGRDIVLREDKKTRAAVDVAYGLGN